MDGQQTVRTGVRKMAFARKGHWDRSISVTEGQSSVTSWRRKGKVGSGEYSQS